MSPRTATGKLLILFCCEDDLNALYRPFNGGIISPRFLADYRSSVEGITNVFKAYKRWDSGRIVLVLHGHSIQPSIRFLHFQTFLSESWSLTLSFDRKFDKRYVYRRKNNSSRVIYSFVKFCCCCLFFLYRKKQTMDEQSGRIENWNKNWWVCFYLW